MAELLSPPQKPSASETNPTPKKDDLEQVMLLRAKSRQEARAKLSEATESGDAEAIAAAQKENDDQYGGYTQERGSKDKTELGKIMDDAGLAGRDNIMVQKEQDEIREKAEAEQEEKATNKLKDIFSMIMGNKE